MTEHQFDFSKLTDAERREFQKRATGLYRKFDVRRADGTDAPGEKHEGCDYFVLDLTHDPFAIQALKAYADACRATYPALAADLDGKVTAALGVSPRSAHDEHPTCSDALRGLLQKRVGG